MKFNELGRSFFRKKLQIRSNFVTTCTTKGTRGAKSPVDATFSGRSMVEMLGVLAIIGVLSVGAIAGYSKAMMKYKLNKHAEQISELINTIHLYQYQFHFDNTSKLWLIPYFQKLNLIHEGMKIVNADDTYLQDSFGSYNIIYAGAAPYNNQTWLDVYGQPKYERPITFTDDATAITYCRNILTAVQVLFRENANDFCAIYMRNQEGGGAYFNLTQGKYDFANMSISDINNLCVQQLKLTDKKQFYYQVCFNNS